MKKLIALRCVGLVLNHLSLYSIGICANLYANAILAILLLQIQICLEITYFEYYNNFIFSFKIFLAFLGEIIFIFT